jgi:hypothetical protein
LQVPEELIQSWGLEDGQYPLTEMLYGEVDPKLKVEAGKGSVPVKLAPLESVILRLDE